MSAKLPPLGTSSSASFLPAYLSETYLTNSSDEDVVLVLRGIHAAAQLVAGLPEGGIELGFLEGHRGFLSFGLLRFAVLVGNSACCSRIVMPWRPQ